MNAVVNNGTLITHKLSDPKVGPILESLTGRKIQAVDTSQFEAAGGARYSSDNIEMFHTFLFVLVASFALALIKNKSNFSSLLMIPLIVALLTKYVMGDWDRGYNWTTSDIFYWSSILAISALTVSVINAINQTK